MRRDTSLSRFYESFFLSLRSSHLNYLPNHLLSLLTEDQLVASIFLGVSTSHLCPPLNYVIVIEL